MEDGAEFKGLREVVIQDIKFQSDNIKFKIERYFLPKINQVVEGSLPAGFGDGQFGPGIKSFIRMLYYQGRVTQNKILKILTGMGVLISAAEVGRMLIDIPEILIEEREEARQEGSAKAGYIQADHTGARIFGMPGHTVVLCNEYFTDFTTSESKNRHSLVSALWGPNDQLYCLNRTALAYLKNKISQKSLKKLQKIAKGDLFDADEFDRKILQLAAVKELPYSSVRELTTACAIAAYRGATPDLVLKAPIMISDDAGNLAGVLRLQGACWIHEARHYELVHVFNNYHQELLNNFLKKLWKLYRRIQVYQKNPTAVEKQCITEAFDSLFTEETGFIRLDQLLPLTMKRKKKLLLALDHPHIPLHNNISETDLRERVIKRKISSGNRSTQGVKAWDTYLSLMHTCRKLNVSFWKYLQDRACNKYEIPQLKKLIQEAA